MSDPRPQTTAFTQPNTPSAEVVREFNDRGTLWRNVVSRYALTKGKRVRRYQG